MTVGPSTYWYLTRATGAVALILLTLSVAVGVAAFGRVKTHRWPRFAIDGIHRTVSLLAIVFLVIHIATAVLDSFAPIRLADAIIPFAGSYRPLWLGLGAAGFDLLLAVIITSLLRARFGYRTWRAVHWLAYLAWPLALVHGLGTGSDVRLGWMLAANVACTAVVLVAVITRAMIGWPKHLRLRLGALGVVLAFTLGLVAWLPAGPLGSHWAQRAGTPASLLAPRSAGHGGSG